MESELRRASELVLERGCGRSTRPVVPESLISEEAPVGASNAVTEPATTLTYSSSTVNLR